MESKDDGRPNTIAMGQRWDREGDVVIAGYGGAGASAAITAHDAGAKVIIVESLDEGGGNTLISMVKKIPPYFAIV